MLQQDPADLDDRLGVLLDAVVRTAPIFSGDAIEVRAVPGTTPSVDSATPVTRFDPMIEWKATCWLGVMARRAVRMGEFVSSVSMLVGNRRNFRVSKACWLSLTSP